MSYDVGFFVREGSALPSVEALDAFFRGRPHYTVESGTASYDDKVTQIDFKIEYGDHRDEEGWDPIRLTAATGAPHTRALELVEEVEALVGAFDLLVNDPQMDGMGKGPLDREALLRGCLKASRFGVFVQMGMSGGAGAAPRVYDDDRLTAQWRWNRAHDATSRAVSDDLFVPRIAYMTSGREVLATVTWTGDMPFVLPDVDALVTLDKAGGGASLKVIPVSAIEATLKDVPFRDAPTRHRVVSPLPAGLMEAVARAKPIAPAPKPVTLWSLLGCAFVEHAKKEFAVWARGLSASSGDETKATPKKKSGAQKKSGAKRKASAKMPAARKKPATTTKARRAKPPKTKAKPVKKRGR